MNSRIKITFIVPVGENKEEIMTFPVKKCMSIQGRLGIIKTVMKKMENLAIIFRDTVESICFRWI